MLLLFSNNAQTTLAGPIASNATTLNVAAGTGSEFPTPISGQQYFVITLNDQATELQREIVWVTARSGDTLTILRAQEGTAARAWLAGDVVANWWTAGQAAAMIQVSQLQIQATNFGIDGGTLNNLFVTLTPIPASLASIAGAPIRIKVGTTNTANTTLTINGLAATTVFLQGGLNNTSLPAGSIIGGQIYEFTYVNGVGFEVSTPKAILSTANPWAASQTMANNNFWSGYSSSAVSLPLIGIDSSNQTTLFAGATGNSAWRVLTSNAVTNLLYISATGANGGLHSVGGFTADTGNIVVTAGNVTASGTVSGVALAAGSSGITSTSGSTGTGDQHRVPTLADFGSAIASGTSGWFTLPAFGMPNNEIIVQFGSVGVPGAPTVNGSYSLPRSYPTNHAAVVISYGSNVPPSTGAIGAQPATLSTFTATNTSPNALSNGCFYISIGW